MKLKFEPDLDYQTAAVNSVCDLFKGQDINRTEFTVTRVSADAAQADLGLDDDGLGVGNRSSLLDDEILANLREVQVRNALAPTDLLESMDFTVEMETGTGKTYVYLKTIFELNKRYGFTKFMIVVPSVAIREGVAKTLEMTREHFRALYAGQPMDSFVYDSAKLGQVRDFATSSTIKVMVATIGSLNKLDTNVFYTPHEKTGGERPVDLVKATRPVIIIDEPQSVEGGIKGAGAKALREMNALCRLRYSATHVHKHHMVYRLDAVDAYEQRLVKRIDVAGLEIVDAHNTSYARLIEVKTAKSRAPTARVELDVQHKGGVSRDVVTVQDGDDLADITGRDVYRDVSIGTIEKTEGGGLVQLNVPGDVRYLREGEAFGDVDRLAIVRRMIERTIREHFTREKALRPLGIKVLSLFFIDRVDRYRVHHEDGSTALGPYGEIFEQEYHKLAAHPDFQTLFAAVPVDPAAAHDGYFSRDKKGRVTEPELNAAGEMKNAASRDDAERGFNLIMRDKEKLLDEATPLRFIFSHSALREGWDNPNVFQICALREMGSETERRQTVGRGLRLCVDKHGDRRRDEGLNVLTVIAGESYAQFAEGLQKQIEQDLGIRFGTVATDAFAALSFSNDKGELEPLGVDQSAALAGWLREQGYIDARGKVQDDLRRALRDPDFALPEVFAAVESAAKAMLTKLAGKLEVRDADERRPVALNREVFLGEEFRALWDRIKAKTTYRLTFDNDALVVDAVARLQAMPAITRAQARWRKAELAIDVGGITGVKERVSGFQHLAHGNAHVPDVLGELQNRTQLTRRTLAKVLVDSERLDDLRQNPASFIDQAANLINKAKVAALVDGVRYQKLGDMQVYAQELFEEQELTGYLSKMVAATKAPTTHVRFDTPSEGVFAEGLNANDAVRVFAKLPAWFKVPTPLGSYNPDWAVLVSTEDGERLYFVVETKPTNLIDDLHHLEAGKVTCGARHFEAIATSPGEPRFVQAGGVDDLMKAVS
ncbi:DEAD/DEAH box helicase family protein [Brevundimonas sp.]|uniref:type III restriction-modification system endonuclease n=1 Tax=Brevundimonas sp. TaxID=1871086 RepID=UPI001E0B16E1|nr:DEAD/DEAH box helicase family protein [Brevundimonas sp.]MBA3999376.1 restriction endonuclease subunit R [Brevundimonas sp.]